MAITMDQVKMWFVSKGVGHIVIATHGGITSTACTGLYFGGGDRTAERPKRICRACHESLDKLTPSKGANDQL